MSTVHQPPLPPTRLPRAYAQTVAPRGPADLNGSARRRQSDQIGAPPSRATGSRLPASALAGPSTYVAPYQSPEKRRRITATIDAAQDGQQTTSRSARLAQNDRQPVIRRPIAVRRVSRPGETDDEQDAEEEERKRRAFARRTSEHLTVPRPRPSAAATRFDLSSSEEDDELEVLEQLTPRVSRMVRPDGLAQFRSRQPSAARSSLSSAMPNGRSRQRTSSAATDLADRRRSVAAGDVLYPGSASGSRRTASFATANEQQRLQVSFQGIDDFDDGNASSANMTMSNPRQRLRPSLSGADGRLDVPTVEERCAVLVINAKGVLSFYMDLQREGWKDDSLNEMVRNWIPFETYKINQLLAEGKYNHHFIDVNEVLRSLQIDADRQPEGFREAMNMANCATFVHYVHQLPDDIEAYGELEDGRITPEVLARAPLRNISELNDARRIFLRWLVPTDWPITDEVLMLLLDMSTQVFIHRLQRNVERVQANTLDEAEAKAVTDNSLKELSSGEIVRHSLQRVMTQRRMTPGDVDRAVMRYETFANIRQIDVQELLYEHEMMRAKWPYHRMVTDLTSYIRDVVREVDAGMHSTSLAQIMSRLERESTLGSSDMPEQVDAGAATSQFGEEESDVMGDEDHIEAESSSIRGPPQSTPRASGTQTRDVDTAFASQFPTWMQEMIEEAETTATGRADPEADEMAGSAFQQSLTESQKAAAVAELLLEDDPIVNADPPNAELLPSDAESGLGGLFPGGSSSSVDLGMPSSPPAVSALFRGQQSSRDISGGRIRSTVATPSTARRVAPTMSGRSSRLRPDDAPSDDLGDDTVRNNEDIRDDIIDSPAKAKASRLGFDNQNRLVRKPTDAKKGRMLDGSSQAIRESRFDSQGEEEEDIFLENATKKGRKGKGKQRARDPPSDATSDVPLPSAKRQTRASARTEAAAIVEPPPSTGQRTSRTRRGVETATEAQTPRRSTRRTRQASAEPSSSIAPTPAVGSRRTRSQAQAEQAATAEVDTEGDRTPRANGRPSTIQEEPEMPAEAEEETEAEEVADTGRGRNAQAGGSRRRAPLAPLQLQDALPADGLEPATFSGGKPDELAFDPVDLSLDLNDDFAGDDDPDILAQRASRDEALARRPPRPGMENFPLPRSSGRAVLQFAPADEAPRSSQAARVVDVLNATRPAKPSRRIGPYRPDRTSSADVESEPHDGSERGDGGRRRREGQSVDELQTPASEGGDTTRRAPTTTQQQTRVEPYKRSNLYITGGNMNGRQLWTAEETTCLLDALYEIARLKLHKPKLQVYAKVLQLHGERGTRSRTLARWNNVQLKDKSRNELIRMRKAHEKIPYWKRLLHPNLWEQKPLRPHAHNGVDAGEETEEVPSDLDDDEDEEDIENDNDNDEEERSIRTRGSQTPSLSRRGDGGGGAARERERGSVVDGRTSASVDGERRRRTRTRTARREEQMMSTKEET